MIKLVKVLDSQKELLYNLNQKYLYEMTNYYDNEFDEHGNISYGYFDLYFIERDKRIPYFIYNENILVGFILINKYSYINKTPDWVIAEATIFPMYRGHHYSVNAFNELLKLHQGSFEVKFNNKNEKARNLWINVTKPYNPVIHHLNSLETVIEFTNK